MHSLDLSGASLVARKFRLPSAFPSARTCADLNIPGTTKHTHYVFVAATSASPATAPVSVWMNGGPGCSSLEGAFAELGQLLVNHDTPSNLVLNPFSWTTISNMLFIEAPTCVGYSYGDSAGDCSHNDTSQALDNYGALQAFFAGFPEYAANDFYITGESYAGIYVPTLAKAVVQGNAAGGGVHINLKGIAVGNGCLGNAAGQCAFDNGVELNTNVPYFAGHGLISSDTYKQFQAACPVGTDPATLPPACSALINQAHNEVGNINIYNIVGPCIDGSAPGRVEASTGKRVYKRAPVPVREGGPIECIDETIAQYIGTPTFAAAFHVNPNLHWAVCGSNASFDYTRTEVDERVDVCVRASGRASERRAGRSAGARRRAVDPPRRPAPPPQVPRHPRRGRARHHLQRRRRCVRAVPRQRGLGRVPRLQRDEAVDGVADARRAGRRLRHRLRKQ